MLRTKCKMSFLFNFLCLFMIAIFCLFAFIAYRLSFWYRQNVPYELTPYFKMNKRLLGDIDKECLAKHGKIFGTFEFLTPVLVVSEPDLIGRIFINEFSKFSDHRKVLLEGQIGAESIFTSDYKQWKKQRSILLPAFSSKKLKLIQPILTKAMEQLLAKLTNSAKQDKEVNIVNYYNEFIIQTSVASSLGVEIDNLDQDNPILKAVDKFFNDMTTLTLKRVVFLMSHRIAKLFNWYFLDYQALKNLHDVVDRVIGMKRQQNNKQYDFINLMLEAEADEENDKIRRLTKTEIIDNAILFLLNGYIHSLAKISYLMALHPEIQNKLSQEIDDALSKSKLTATNKKLGHKQHEITWEELDQMPYLNAVFNETLRLYPNTPRLERRVPEDTHLTGTRYGDIFLPKDSLVCISLANHQDPDYWPEPDKFNPDRFLPENKHLNHPYAHFPFALGPRNCIGGRFGLMRIKQCVFNVFRKFRFKVSEGTHIPLRFTTGLVPFYKLENVTLKVVARN